MPYDPFDFPTEPPPRTDKDQHALTGAAIGNATSSLLPGLAKPVRLLVPAAAAIAKELYDNHHRKEHTPDPWDAAATAFGAALSYASDDGNFQATPVIGRDQVGLDVVWRF